MEGQSPKQRAPPWLTTDIRSRLRARVLNHFGRVQLFATYGLWPVRLLCPWNSPGKNTGVPPPGDLLEPGIEPRSSASPALQADSLPLSHTVFITIPQPWPQASKNRHLPYITWLAPAVWGGPGPQAHKGTLPMWTSQGPACCLPGARQGPVLAVGCAGFGPPKRAELSLYCPLDLNI